MEHPTVSVIIPNYNHSRYVAEALESVLAQFSKPLEVIIVDDGSTDNSVSVIESFIRQHPTFRLVVNQCNSGVVCAVNRGLALATGDYVFGMAADDRIKPGFLQRLMLLLSQHPCAGLCSTLTTVIDEAGNENGVLRTPIVAYRECYLPPSETPRLFRRYGSWIMGNTTIYRRQALLESGGFIPELASFSDGFVQQVIALRYGACFIPESLTEWRRMGTGYASTTMADITASMQMMRYAEYLMTTTYSSLFSPNYIRDWRREWLYWTGLACWIRQANQHLSLLERIRAQLLPSWLDLPLLWSARFLTKAGMITIRIHLFLRLRSLPRWLRCLYRRVVWMLSKVAYAG